MEETKETKVSTTDPESGYMVRDGKPEGFFYLDHRTVDHKYNIITDVHVTPGNIHDSVPYIERLEYIVEKFKFEKTLEAIALDAGYFTSHELQLCSPFFVQRHKYIHYTHNPF